MREGWTYKKLGEVATIRNGFAFQSALFQRAGLPIIRISNIQDDKITSDFVYFNRDDYNIDFEKYKVLFGDILIAMSGATTGKVGINYNKGILYLNQRVGKIVPRESVIHRFLFYYLKTNATKSLSIAQGVAQPNLSTQQINSFVLPVPPLSEQQRIVSELDLLSGIIEKKKAQLKEYDQLAQSIFYDMFGDPVANDKGWEVRKLGEVYKLKSGDSLSAKQFVDGQYPVYGGNGISGYHNAFNMEGNYIIIGRVGAYCGNVRNVIGKFWLTDNAFQLIYDVEQQNPIFVTYVLTYLDLHQYANHAAQPVISNITLKEIKIPYPPLSLQQSFASKIEAIERQKALIQQSITEAETLFNSRMDYWFL